MTAGFAPQSAADVNAQIGSLLRQFSNLRDQVFRYQRVCAAIDMKILPGWAAGQAGIDDEANIKSAISTLNTDLQAFSMTFSDRLTGFF